MYNKYLNDNPLPWLLEETLIPVRYLTLRDIVKGPDLSEEYQKLENCREIQIILDNSHNNILGDQDSYDIFYKGTLWSFCKAVAMGLNSKTAIITDTADYIIKNYQLTSGGFSQDWKPRRESGLTTGTVVYYFLLAGLHNNAVDRAIEWILSIQRTDGGWRFSPVSNYPDLAKLILFNRSGSGVQTEDDIRKKSCPYATIACANALLLYSRINTNNKIDRALQRAARYFIAIKLYRPFPDTFYSMIINSNRDLGKLGYPILAQYDVLTGLLFLARLGMQNTHAFTESFNYIMSKQNPGATWNLENISTGMLHNRKDKKYLYRPDKWVTLNVLRLLNRLTG